MRRKRRGPDPKRAAPVRSSGSWLRYGLLGCASAVVFLQVFFMIGGAASSVRPLDPVTLADLPPALPLQHEVTSKDIHRTYRAGLNWLRRHQFPEGMWSPAHFHLMCPGVLCRGAGEANYDVPLTALSLVAFLSQDYRSVSPEDQDAVLKGIDWLFARQGKDGSFLSHHAGKFMYGQALATEAMARGYLATGSEKALVAAQRGVRFIEQARNPGSVWRYGVRPGDNDSSVTAWVVSALIQMKAMGYGSPPEVLEGIRGWIDQVTDDRHYGVAYRTRGNGQAFTSSNQDYVPNEAMTAAGLMMRKVVETRGSDVPVQKGITRMLTNLPTWDPRGRSVDFYYWHMGTRAFSLYRQDAPELRERWNSRAADVLVTHQRNWRDGCLAGSWDPVDKWGQEGGRVYATALNTVTLGLLLEPQK